MQRINLPEKIKKKVMPVTESGCWLWLGPLRHHDYACVSLKGKKYSGHRLFYEAANGPIPDGMVVDHLCRVRCCVNPDHMQIVTNKENVLRGLGHTAMNAKKTHCKYGHELSGDNLRIRPLGRGCKACRKAGR